MVTEMEDRCGYEWDGGEDAMMSGDRCDGK